LLIFRERAEFIQVAASGGRIARENTGIELIPSRGFINVPPVVPISDWSSPGDIRRLPLLGQHVLVFLEFERQLRQSTLSSRWQWETVGGGLLRRCHRSTRAMSTTRNQHCDSWWIPNRSHAATHDHAKRIAFPKPEYSADFCSECCPFRRTGLRNELESHCEPAGEDGSKQVNAIGG
jgi:hypothetical protein